MTQQELDEILDRVADMVLPESDRQEGEFNAAEFGERHDLTREQARSLLDSMVNDGRLRMRKGRNQKRKSTWYRIA